MSIYTFVGPEGLQYTKNIKRNQYEHKNMYSINM